MERLQRTPDKKRLREKAEEVAKLLFPEKADYKERKYALLIHEKYKDGGNEWRTLSPKKELEISLYEAEHGITEQQRLEIYSKYLPQFAMIKAYGIKEH